MYLRSLLSSQASSVLFISRDVETCETSILDYLIFGQIELYFSYAMSIEEQLCSTQFAFYQDLRNDELDSWTYSLDANSNVSGQVSFMDPFLESSLDLPSYGTYSGLIPDLSFAYPPFFTHSNSDYYLQKSFWLPDAYMPIATPSDCKTKH